MGGFLSASFLLLTMRDFVLAAEKVTSHLCDQALILVRSSFIRAAASSLLSTSMNRQVSSAKSLVLVWPTDSTYL